MKNVNRRPPRLAALLLSFFLPEDIRETTPGDFEEEFSDICDEHGYWRALFWYWIQVVRSCAAYSYVAVVWSYAMLRSYFVIAARNVMKNRVYSMLNIGGLAVGFAVFVLIGMYIFFEINYEEEHLNADRIIGVIQSESASTPPALAPAFAANFPEIESAVRLLDSDEIIVEFNDNKFIERNWAWADNEVFSVFTFPLVSGDSSTALLNRHSVVISETMADKYFGSEDPLFKILKCVWSNHEIEFTITGVMKDTPVNSHIKADFFANIETIGGYGLPELDTSWSNYYVKTFFLLKNGVDPDLLQEKYPGLLTSRYGFSRGDGFINKPLKSFHLRLPHLNYHFCPVNDIRSIYLLSAIAVIIIAIAGINYINLTTAQTSRRIREAGIRRVSGAQTSQVFRQHLAETVFITLLSLAAAFVLVYLLLPTFNNLVECEKPLAISENGGLIFKLMLFGLFVFALVGSYPAMYVARFRLLDTLKGPVSSVQKNSRLRNSLVTVQFVISIFLIISTLVTSDQVSFIRNKELGFSKENIVSVVIRGSYNAENRIGLKNELLRHAEITAAGFSHLKPMKIDWNTRFVFRNRLDPENNKVRSNYVQADEGFVDVFDLQIVRGSNFPVNPAPGTDYFLINELLAETLGYEDPIGMPLNVDWSEKDGVRGEITGVVRNFHNRDMSRPVGPVAVWYRPANANLLSVKADTGDMPGLLAFIEKTINDFSDKPYPFEFEFMDESYDRMYRSVIQFGNTFYYFSLLALVICCLGLFGLVSFTVGQSVKEIGIRKSLGATDFDLTGMLIWRFMKWIALAHIIAWPLAYLYMNRWLQNFVYRTDIGMELFGYATIIATGTAFLTIIAHTLKAARSNPADSLRYE